MIIILILGIHLCLGVFLQVLGGSQVLLHQKISGHDGLVLAFLFSEQVIHHCILVEVVKERYTLAAGAVALAHRKSLPHAMLCGGATRVRIDYAV